MLSECWRINYLQCYHEWNFDSLGFFPNMKYVHSIIITSLRLITNVSVTEQSLKMLVHKPQIFTQLTPSMLSQAAMLVTYFRGRPVLFLARTTQRNHISTYDPPQIVFTRSLSIKNFTFFFIFIKSLLLFTLRELNLILLGT
jgi:hypothetical protein